ncbi:MAG: ATP-binding protein [Ignavibacteriaceae bacterium]|nr:ATP-binding protein [Ignavibacteriaceae bacterium]
MKLSRKKVVEMVEDGENFNCEFKRKFSTPEKIAREMIAFANSRGGYIFFGVDDDKTIVGVESEKGETELIKDAALNYCEPPLEYSIQYIPFDGKEVVIVEVPESKNKPHRLQDYLNEFDINTAVVTLRVNDKSVHASKEMIRIMRSVTAGLTLKKYHIGEVEKRVFQFIEKSETISVKQLSDYINISERRASRTLVKMVRANLLAIHTKDNGEEFFTGIENL